MAAETWSGSASHDEAELETKLPFATWRCLETSLVLPLTVALLHSLGHFPPSAISTELPQCHPMPGMPRVPASHGKDRGRWSGVVASCLLVPAHLH